MSQELSMGGLLEKSRYLPRFRRLAEIAPGALQVEGDLIIVERLEKLESSVTLKDKDGKDIKLAIADVQSHKMTHSDKHMDIGVVVFAGPGDVVDGERVAMNVKVGELILLPGNVVWYSQFGSLTNYEPYSLGVTRDSAVLMHFPDPVKAFEVLNGG